MANKRAADYIANSGLRNGWLYRTADEAIAAGIANPELIRKISKLGDMKTELSDLYTSPEYVQMFKGTGGVLDNLIMIPIYREIMHRKSFSTSW